MENTNHSIDRLASLIRIAGEIQAQRSTDSILALITDSAVELMNAESCTILFKENAEERVIQTFAPGIQEQLNREETQVASALFVPVSIGEKAVGSLQVVNGIHQQPFAMEDLELFQAFAHLCSITLNNAALNQSLTEKIADLEKKNRELFETRNHLVNSEKLTIIGQMAAGFSHEIRNLITPIRLIAEDPPDPHAFKIETVLEEYKLIADQINKAMNMATGFLSFSRQGHEKNPNLSVNEVVEKALNLISHRFKKENIKLATSLADTLPPVAGNAAQLEQVIVNCLNNADDAMKGEGSIHISTELAGTQILIKIRDSGSGIKPEDLKRIMEPFFTTKSEKQGTGLGLTICSHIMEQHGGKILFESEWGKGTTAILTLPAADTP